MFTIIKAKKMCMFYRHFLNDEKYIIRVNSKQPYN
jgi:hypothetical protein